MAVTTVKLLQLSLAKDWTRYLKSVVARWNVVLKVFSYIENSVIQSREGRKCLAKFHPWVGKSYSIQRSTACFFVLFRNITLRDILCGLCCVINWDWVSVCRSSVCKLNRLQTMLPSSSWRGFGGVRGKALHTTTGPLCFYCFLIGGNANVIITKTVPLLSSFLPFLEWSISIQ